MERVYQFVLVALFSISAYAQNIENIVKNGSFEHNFAQWSTSGAVFFSTNLASGGEKSYGISTNVQNHGFIYQNLAHSISSFKASFWVFPQSDTYQSTFELVANWNRTTAKIISRFIIKQDSIRMTTLQTDTTIAFTMQLNNWYQFSILTDSLGWYKKYYINGSFICSQKSSEVVPVETIIVGDVSDRKRFGALHYDDIVFLSRQDYDEVGSLDRIDLGTTSMRGNENHRLGQFSLEQNYPNPFNPNTKLEFTLSEPSHIKLSIYNNRGQIIRTLADENRRTGTYSIQWNGMNDRGQKVSSGVYYFKLETATGVISKKMILLK